MTNTQDDSFHYQRNGDFALRRLGCGGFSCAATEEGNVGDVDRTVFDEALGVGQLGISWMIDDRCRHRVR